jgi:L-alanine-DL-glutamate epimerase-like enolase superfamily enzyme
VSRIASVTPISVAYPEPNDAGSTRHLTFCRVAAEDGTVGWGEAITMTSGASRATEKLVEELADLLVGRDPLANVELWRSLKAHMWWYGYRGGLASFALSCIDVALWDLKGKLLGVPLVDLIGGAVVDRLPAVASTHAFDASIENEAERHGRYVRQGYVGVKVGFGKHGDARLGYELDRDVTFVRLLREAIGPAARLMVDRSQALPWTVADVLARVSAFEQHDLTWIEEPFEPTDVHGFRILRGQARTLVAGGEREWDARGFEELVSARAVDVVGCDVGRAEGVTGALKVIELGERSDLWFNSHAWSSAVNTAASLALSASTRRCLLQELKPDESPMQHELVDEPFVQRGGWIDVPRRPGHGAEPDGRVLERYRLR